MKTDDLCAVFGKFHVGGVMRERHLTGSGKHSGLPPAGNRLTCRDSRLADQGAKFQALRRFVSTDGNEYTPDVPLLARQIRDGEPRPSLGSSNSHPA